MLRMSILTHQKTPNAPAGSVRCFGWRHADRYDDVADAVGVMMGWALICCKLCARPCLDQA
jgi:hypothetical protein